MGFDPGAKSNTLKFFAYLTVIPGIESFKFNNWRIFVPTIIIALLPILLDSTSPSGFSCSFFN